MNSLQRGESSAYLISTRCLRLFLLFLFMAFWTACQLETVYGANEKMWLWLATPFLGFVIIGSMLIWMSRGRQLSKWNLAQSPSDPSVSRILLWTIGTAAVLAIVFVLQNIFFDIADSQKLWNIGLWLLGSILGVAIALYIGLNLAEPKATRS